MSSYIITFPVGGPLAAKWSSIEADTEHAARLALVGVYGRKGWAGIYPMDKEHLDMVDKHDLQSVRFGYGFETAQDYES